MEFNELLDIIERYVEHLWTIHPDRGERLNEAKGIIKEMKFNGMFNTKFRDENIQPLEELLDQLYTQVHTQ